MSEALGGAVAMEFRLEEDQPGSLEPIVLGEEMSATRHIGYAVQWFAMTIALVIAYVVLGVRRGLKSEYFIFTDPLIILAGAFLLERMPDLRLRKWAYPIALILFTLQIVISQAEPIKYALMRRGPEPICEWNQHYLPLMPLPWCPVSHS